MASELHLLREIDHTGTLKLHEIYENDQYVYIVQEKIEGENLGTIMKSNKKFKKREIAKIMKGLMLATNYLHGKGIIHRDINPECFVISYLLP